MDVIKKNLTIQGKKWMKIVHLIIKRFEIQSIVSFAMVNINDVACQEFNNVSF
jgi:hypothetical protein